MTIPRYSSLEVGTAIPSLTLPPITRHALAIYCGASGDHNPLHVDIDFARAAGLPDVIAHGMLVMAYMGRTLTQWVPQERLRGFSTRFMAMTHVGDAITCTGAVLEKLERDGEKLVRVSISAADQRGEVKTAGEALIALDP